MKAPGRSTAGTIEQYDEVFLYDTATGRVWMYEPSSPFLENEVGKEIQVREYFDELIGDNLHGSHDADVDRSFRLYSAAFDATVKSYCNKDPKGTYHVHPQETGSGIDCADFLAKHPDPGPDQK
jgi:hypothetical protein